MAVSNRSHIVAESLPLALPHPHPPSLCVSPPFLPCISITPRTPAVLLALKRSLVSPLLVIELSLECRAGVNQKQQEQQQQHQLTTQQQQQLTRLTHKENSNKHLHFRELFLKNTTTSER